MDSQTDSQTVDRARVARMHATKKSIIKTIKLFLPDHPRNRALLGTVFELADVFCFTCFLSGFILRAGWQKIL